MSKQNYKTLIKVQEDLQFLTKSEIRLAILNCLNHEPCTVKEIVSMTGLTYSSVSSNVNKLEKNGDIYRCEGRYYMSHLTKIYLESILEFNQSLSIITNFEDFWHNHIIDDIDYESIKNLTNIYESELVESTSIDIYKTYNTIKEQLVGSENIQAIFPYLHPEYPKLIENELKNGAKIELIVNNDIYKSLIFTIDNKIRKKSVRNGNLIVHPVKKPLNIYLTISDNDISLGLFKSDLSFDQNRILTSSHPKALSWCENLFDEIKNRI